MKKLSYSLIFGSSLCLAFLSAHGTILALYDFNNSVADTNVADFANKATSSNVSSGSLLTGPGLPFTSTNGGVFSGNGTVSDGIWLFTGGSGSQVSYNSGFTLAIPAGITTATLADAITAGDSLSFTVTPDAGYNVSVDNLSFLYSGNNTNSWANQIAVRLNGVQVEPTFTLTRVAQSTYDLVSLDLSGAEFTSNSAFTVEIFFFGKEGGIATRNLQIDDLALNGSVSVIPEPSTYAALAGLAVLGLAAWRRRQR